MGLKRFFLNLMPSYFVWFFARPYVAGSSLQKALDKVESLWQGKKCMSSVDLLGEDVSSIEEVDAMVKIYLDLLEGLKHKSQYASVSLKPTALGINLSKEICLNNLKKILEKAKSYKIAVTMDMEDSPYTTSTLNLYSILRPLYPNFGTVLQTRLFRTEDDITNLPHNSHIRLCIGIYLEAKEIAIQKRKDMKEKLFEYTKDLLENKHFVAVATHDKQLLEKLLSYVDQKKIKNSQIEFQFLLGVPRDNIQKRILNLGYNVRLYVPFATQKKYATKYAIRRFDENPHMAIYVIKNLWAKFWVKLVIFIGIFLFIAYIGILFTS